MCFNVFAAVSNVSASVHRFGFRHVTETYGGIQIVETVNNSDDESRSYDLTADMLRRHPEINALYFTAGGVYGGCHLRLRPESPGRAGRRSSHGRHCHCKEK